MKGWVLAAAVACAGCSARVASDRAVRIERLASEHRALMERLDDLQARLLVDRQRVQFWEEMRDRHASVSALACTSQEAHAMAMAERLLPEEPQQPVARLRQARVAAVRTAAPAATRRP